ncbi:MAG: acyltransferase [Rickettsiales bacterium]|jgi:peptidoglycan/LPS O-acetylase OafA/YrhL
MTKIIPTHTSKQIFYNLDGIRGILAILVLFRHTTAFFGDAVHFQVAYLAVDVFFLMSGVVISQAYEHKLKTGLSAVKFSLIRFIRIYPLYILGTCFTVLSVLMGLSNNEPVQDNFFLLTLFAVFLMPNLFVHISSFPGNPIIIFPMNGPAWSLFFEMAANIFYGMIVRFLSLSILIFIIAFSALGLAASIYFVSSNNLDVGWTIKQIPSGAFRVGYSFFTGVLLYRIFQTRQEKRTFYINEKWSLLASWGLLALISAMLMYSPTESVAPYYDFIMVTLIFPILIYGAILVQPTGLTVRIFSFLGGVSYAIYALHSPLSHLIQDVSRDGGVLVDNYAPWGGIVFLGILITLCWLLDKYYDAPVRRFLLSMIKGKKSKNVESLRAVQ